MTAASPDSPDATAPAAASADEPAGPGGPPAADPGVAQSGRRGVLARLGAPRSGRSRLRRRVGTGVRLALALALVGGVYAAFAPNTRATATPSLEDTAQAGKAVYDLSCVSCHGPNGEGVPNQGPSLIGVGSAAVYFQVTTGRMPAARSQNQPPAKKPVLTEKQAVELGEYIQQLGGGPETPRESNEDLAKGDVSRGGELYRLNCSSCHAFGGAGGALSAGSYAPGLKDADPRQIYTAMLSGPQNMPVFGDAQLSAEEKKDIIAYIDSLKQRQADPGGFNLGGLGPSTETIVIFVVGIVALLFTTLWIAGKS